MIRQLMNPPKPVDYNNLGFYGVCDYYAIAIRSAPDLGELGDFLSICEGGDLTWVKDGEHIYFWAGDEKYTIDRINRVRGFLGGKSK